MKIRLIVITILAVIIIIATACVEDAVFVGPASISGVSGTPVSPQSTESVVIKAKITDLKGVTSAKLYYKVSTVATFTAVDMTSLSSEQFMWVGTIPPFAKDIKVEYYIEVTNIDNLNALFPANAPTAKASYIVGASTLIKIFVNEVFPDGTKDATDPDWVEIYNDSEIPVDLAGYFFYDEGIKITLGTATKKPKRVLGSIMIPPKGFTVIATEYNGESVTFGLSTTGDAMYIENPNGVLVATLDFNTIVTTGKKSYGRKPDGSNTLMLFNTATKGTSNNNAN
ncbi:MAG: lamin tail domain-containing protein [Paludibacter sp.]|nr:lamin tail domain-containing protein [Paludibacter sp.]